jgi:hypothetical protein
VLVGLGLKDGRITTRSQGHDPKTLLVRFNHVERLRTDRASAAEYSDADAAVSVVLHPKTQTGRSTR